MVTRNKILRQRSRRRLPLLSILLCSGVGCALPHGQYQGDPGFGNFNRPIAASPPVFSGGEGGMGPASDGGARLGMASPDVPDPANPTGASKASWLMPTYSFSGGLLNLRGGGGSGGISSGSSTAAGGGRQSLVGARLQGVEEPRRPLLANTNLTPPSDSTSVTFRTREPNTLMMSGFRDRSAWPGKGSARGCHL